MTKEDQTILKQWLRGIEIHDEDDDGIGEFMMRFKVRDEPDTMVRIYHAMSHNDACEIAEMYIRDLCPGCEMFHEDWNNLDSGFGLSFELDDNGFIVIKGEYRT